MKKILLLLSAVALLPQTAGAVETIYTNADIYTVEKELPQAQAMAVSNGKIVAIGTQKEVAQRKTEQTRIVDLQGRFVMPGFVSSHIHPGVAALMGTGVQLVGVNDKQEILNTLRDYDAVHPGNEPILGFGWSPSVFGAEGPTAAFLDQAVKTRPVFLVASDAHSGWVNTAGLEFLGIAKDTPDPVPGVHYYKRDAGGNPTGWLIEASAFWPALGKMGLGSTERFVQAYQGFLPTLSSIGVTTVFDAGVPIIEKPAFDALLALEKRGELPVRYYASHFLVTKKDAASAKEDFLNLRETYNTGRLKMYAMKISNDGTIEASTAALIDPYHTHQDDGHAHYGSVLFSEDELYALIKPLDDADIPMMIHAIGDRTSHEAINVLARIELENPNGAARHSITHLQLMKDGDAERMREAGIIAQISPPWAQDVNLSLATWKTLLGEERSVKLMRFKDMFDAGVTVSMGSDFPASGVGFLESSPLYGIDVGMTRKLTGQPDSIVLPSADQRLDLEQLIWGYTMGSAHQLAAENEIGSLKAGKNADFIVLSHNPFELEPEQIHTINVLQTVVGGKTVFEH